VVPGITATVRGAVVHFCTTQCAATYRGNPARFERTLRSDSVVARRLDQANAAFAAASDRGSGGAGGAPAPMHDAEHSTLHDSMRKLWADHVIWTRSFVVSALSDLPDRDAATNRLLKNQDDIGNAIQAFYGDEAGTKLTALLRGYITVAADLVMALKAGDAAKAEVEQKRWVANADEIAGFLAKANPSSWPLEDARKMMRKHLDLTTVAVKARLDKDWEADVAAYEKIHDQALRMADMLTEGIRKQFPDKAK
jgi:hypothetical protein